MDFKALMSAQISKSKQSNTTKPQYPTPSKSPSPDTSTSSKYTRRADLEAAREAAYVAEQERLHSEREERAAKKRKFEEDEAEKNARREEKLRRLAEESKRRRENEEMEEERRRRKRLGLPDVDEQNKIEDGAAGDGENGQDAEDIPDEELRSKLRGLK